MLMVPQESISFKRYRFLEAYAFGMKPIGIGRPYPEEFEKLLKKELHSGHMISFDGIDSDHQVSIVCIKSTAGYVDYQLFYLGKYTDISASKFNEAPIKTLYYSEKRDMQCLYNIVKTLSGNIILRHEDINGFAQEQINGLLNKLKSSRVAILKCGNEQLKVKRNIRGKLIWYDHTNTKITENAAKAFIAWCHNAPVAVNVSDVKKLIGNTKNYEEYLECEEKIKLGDYVSAKQKMESLCLRNDEDFSISLIRLSDTFCNA